MRDLAYRNSALHYCGDIICRKSLFEEETNYRTFEHSELCFVKNFKFQIIKNTIMKKLLSISLVTFALLMTGNASGQGFVETIEGDAIGALFGNECVVNLTSGEEITGKFTSGMYVTNGLTKITVKLENGEKVKLVPEQIVAMQIKSSGLLKLSMISEGGSSIKELAKTDFKDIVNREWVVFETAMTPKKTDTYRLLQLLNPGFSGKIKVFAEPGSKTGGIGIGGLQITGGEDRAYLFVKGGEKAVKVKKSSYSENFQELYSDCPEMVAAFQGEKIKWDDVAMHVYAYDKACK